MQNYPVENTKKSIKDFRLEVVDPSPDISIKEINFLKGSFRSSTKIILIKKYPK